MTTEKKESEMTRTIEVSDETYEKIKDELGEDVNEITTLEEIVGKSYAFQCARYIWYGKVKNVTPTYIELTNAAIVYETGEFTAKKASDMQELPKQSVFLMRQGIEAFYPTRW